MDFLRLIHRPPTKDQTSACHLHGVMLTGAMPSELLQRLQTSLTNLRAARPLAGTTAVRVAIDSAIVDVLEGILASDGGMPQISAPQLIEPSSSPQPSQPVDRPMSKHSPFYGMG